MRWRAGLALALAAAARLAVAGGEGEERVDGPVIGIDLGTTYSCAAVYKSGQVEVIPNEHGGRVTPSVVAFTDDGQLVGEAAKSQANANLARTFFDVKRFIGRNTKQDAAVMKDLAKLPFKLVDRPDGSVAFSVDAKGVEKDYAPEQVTAVLIRKLKDAAEAHLGTKVKSAVITVPSSFNNSQRQATKDAAAVAGLTVLRLLNEPTAAALAYGLDKQASRTVLVYDLGGGTFDVSVLRIENGVFQVLATAGDSHLGGEDFNRKLVDHWLEAAEKKHGRRPSSAADLQRLRQEAEKVKRMLSSTPQARYSIKGLEGGAELAGSMTRARFEDLNQDLFHGTIELVKAALKDAGVPKSGVDDVVLVGGSTRIPKVQQLVREFFDNKELTRGLNPDEAVAYGAAIQASALSSWTGGGGASAVLLDVTPLTLGIETVGGVMTALISRNSPIPTRNSTTVTTHRDNQPALDVKVFEGERLLTRNNHFLGKFRLGGIPPAPRGQPQVELTFAVDADGILTVTAEDRGSGQNASLTVTSEQGRLSPEQIEAMVKEAEEFLEADIQAKGRADARIALEVYLQSVQGLLDGENEVALPDSDRDRARTAVLDGKDWLAANLEAGADEVREKLAEVQSLCGDLAPQHAGGGAHGHGSDDHDMEGHDEL